MRGRNREQMNSRSASVAASVSWKGRVNAWDGALLIPKGIFFFLNVLLYTTYTYQAEYLQEVWDLKITHFGYIASIPSISFFCAIFWSALAQRTHRYRTIVVAVSLAYSSTFVLLHLLSPFLKEWPGRFYLVMAAFGLMSVLSSALFPLIDHKIYVKLSQDRRFSSRLFGNQRLWGTVGQGVGGLVAGMAINAFGFTSLFVISAVCCSVLVVLVSIGITNDNDRGPAGLKEADKLESAKTVSRHSQVLKLMTSAKFILFLLVVLIAGYSRAVVGNLLVLYLGGYFHVDRQYSGLLMLVRTVPEILCFYYSRWCLEHFGVNWMLFIAQMAGLVRVGAYGWLPASAKWMLFMIESLRGVNNAFMMAAGVRLAHDLAPQDGQTVAQGFFHGILGNLTTGIAGILTSVLSSILSASHPELSETQKITVIFRWSALASNVGLVVFLAFYATVRGSQPRLKLATVA